METKCPKCGAFVPLPPGAESGTPVTCPKCGNVFMYHGRPASANTGNPRIDEKIRQQQRAAAEQGPPMRMADEMAPGGYADPATVREARHVRERNRLAGAAASFDAALEPHQSEGTGRLRGIYKFQDADGGGPRTSGEGFVGPPGTPPPTPGGYDYPSDDGRPPRGRLGEVGDTEGPNWAGVGDTAPPRDQPSPGSDNDPTKLLRDIRDGIRALSGGYNPATGQSGHGRHKELGDEETKKFYSRAGSLDDWSNLLAGQSAGQSQSGSNLFGMIRTVGGNLLKRRRGWGGQKILSTHGAHIPPPDSGKRGRRAPDPTAPAGDRGGKKGGHPKDALTDAARHKTAAAAGAESGLLGGAARKLSGLGAAALEAGKAVYAFARAQEKEIRRLAEVGGEQAAAVAILDVNRIKRDINTARETGETSTGLTDSINRFEEALRPVEALMTNLANKVGSVLLDGLTNVVDVLGGIAEGVSGILADLGLWSKEESKRRLKELPAAQIERIVKNQEKIERPQWPGAGIGGPGSVSAPVHGGPSGWQ